MMGVKLSRIFAIRCLLKTRPYLFLSCLIIFCVFSTSYILKIIEGPFFDGSKEKRFNNYTTIENCIWTVLVTMTTVGYGDLYPSSNYGRFLLLFSAVVGTILISLVIITLQQQFQFNPTEDNAYRFYERIKTKADIQRKGAICFKNTFQFLRSRSKFTNYLKSNQNSKNAKNTSEYYNLKNNVKDAAYNRIKSNKDFKREFQ